MIGARTDYQLRRTVDPVEEPLDIQTLKAQCGVEVSETYFDSWFAGNPLYTGGALAAARELVEHDAQVALMPQTWQLRLDGWSDDDVIDLIIHPVQSVTVSYEDESDVTQVWAASSYEVQRSKYRSALMVTDADVDYPSVSGSGARPITITIAAGYSNATSQTTLAARRAKVPHAAKMAILMLVAHWFRNRESTATGTISKEIELGYKSLVRSMRPERYA